VPVPEAPPPAPAKPEEPPAAPPEITLEVLRGLATKLLEKQRLPDIIEVNKRHGIRKITECPQEKWTALYEDLKTLVDGLG